MPVALTAAGCVNVAPPASAPATVARSGPDPDRPIAARAVEPIAAGPISKASAPEEIGHVYRLDFAVTSEDPKDAPRTGNFTINVEENHTGEIHAGSNVPLSHDGDAKGEKGEKASFAGPAPRMDMGLSLRATVHAVGDDVLVETETELSDADGSAIRKLRSRGETFVTPGKPAVVTSNEEAGGKKRYQVVVSVTKVR